MGYFKSSLEIIACTDKLSASKLREERTRDITLELKEESHRAATAAS